MTELCVKHKIRKRDRAEYKLPPLRFPPAKDASFGVQRYYIDFAVDHQYLLDNMSIAQLCRIILSSLRSSPANAAYTPAPSG
jgi:hypothetical protein